MLVSVDQKMVLYSNRGVYLLMAEQYCRNDGWVMFVLCVRTVINSAEVWLYGGAVRLYDGKPTKPQSHTDGRYGVAVRWKTGCRTVEKWRPYGRK